MINTLKRISLLFILIATPFFANLSANNHIPETKGSIVKAREPINYFWFFVRVSIDRKTKSYQILGTGSRLMSGTLDEFDKAIWWGLAHRQIAIGPFEDKNIALNSKILYKRKKEKINELPAVEPPETVYWFQISFIKLPRTGTFKLKHMPAAVAPGATSDFIDALYEGISFERFSVGPFWDYNQAEAAKAIYRRNE